jgi:hypothetical protein
MLLAVMIAWAALVSSARAQEQEVRTIKFDDMDVFCHILHTFDLKPVPTVKAALADPTNTLIIVLGDPRGMVQMRRLHPYLDQGGNVLIATDRPWRSDDGRVSIVGRPMVMPPPFSYRMVPECPRLTPRFLDNHPLFHFLTRGIATNCPSYMDVPENDRTLQDLLVYPAGPSRIAGQGLRGGLFRYMVGSAGNAAPRGRELYIAGHGMFMNGMMVQEDNDNFEFTRNAIRWLREGPNGRDRTKALLIIDGETVSEFDKKLTPPLPPIPMPPLTVLARLLRGLEDERFFHHLLGDIMGERTGMVVAILFGIITFVVLIYAAKKFMEGRTHVEAKVPSLLGPQPVMSATEPIEQRQRALLRQRDFWEEARFLVLKWFRQEFDVTPHRWHAEVNAAFQAEGFWWSRSALRRQANFVLRLARDPEKTPISRHDFFVLLETLRALTAAVQDGRLALLVEGKNVRQT